jgi:predicted secreted protein
MAWTTALAIYFIIWWVMLFAVLPWGIRSQAEAGSVIPGSEPGAPDFPRLLARLAWTTLVSAIVFAALAFAYAYQLVSMEQLTTWFGVLK